MSQNLWLSLFVCQELIQYFTIEEGENLDLDFDASCNLDENSADAPQLILQHNEKVNINSLIMNTGNIPETTSDKK